MVRETRSVLFVLTSPFSTRDYMADPLFENVVSTVRKHGLTPVFSSYETSIEDFVKKNGAEFEPLASTGNGLLRSRLWKIKNSFLFRSATYRHNEVNGFAHHEDSRKSLTGGANPSIQRSGLTMSGRHTWGFPSPEAVGCLALSPHCLDPVFSTTRKPFNGCLQRINLRW